MGEPPALSRAVGKYLSLQILFAPPLPFTASRLVNLRNSLLVKVRNLKRARGTKEKRQLSREDRHVDQFLNYPCLQGYDICGN